VKRRGGLSDGWLCTGDLGRLSEDGHLTLVGRKKDVILDASGKNVYPDELEELYGRTELIQELSIVGLPDSSGAHERVACLAVPRKPTSPPARRARRSGRRSRARLPHLGRPALLKR